MLAPDARAVTTDMRRDSRRQAILTAATALLFEDNNPTARSIAARAGLSLKYIYESFDSVDEILVVSYEEALHGLRRTVTGALATAPNTIEGASRAVVTSQYDFHRDHPEQARMLSTRAHSHPKLALCRLDQFERGIADFAEILTRLGIADPLLVSRFLVGALGESLSAYLNGQLSLGREDFIETCTDMFVQLLRSRQDRTDQDSSSSS